MRAFIIFMLALFVIAIVGCSPKTEKTISVDYLFPALRRSSVQSITLRSAEGQTRLVIHDGQWWVDKPTSYPASNRSVKGFLTTLVDAEVGKKIAVSGDGYSALGLAPKNNPITAVMITRSGQKITIVFGDMTFSEKSDSPNLLGSNLSANRYIRVIGKTDLVYLAPFSLVDLDASPILWTDSKIPRIPSFKSLRVIKGHKTINKYTRDAMFRPVEQVKPHENSGSHTFYGLACVDHFLASGKSYYTGQPIAMTSGWGRYSIKVQDFLGLTYTFTIAESQSPTAAQKKRAKLSSGMFNEGVAPHVIPVMVSINKKLKKSLNPIEKSLREHNLELIKRLNKRVFYVREKTLSCLSDRVGS